jgi:ABC-2 type transport system ATP-binding protein
VAPEIGEPVPAPESPGASPIECRSLEISYGEKQAVAGLSFSVAAGEVVAILGPNGAGKTSTVETLEGYRRPTSGSVRVLGLDPRTDHKKVVGRIGVMLQRGGIYPTMTAGEAVRLFARYYENPEDPQELLETLDLLRVQRTPWRRLSGGEQQRVSLALALVGRPTVAFLDEPTAGVDPEGRITIRQVIARLKEGGASVLLTTHELAEAERVADRVIILAEGKCVAEGTLDQLAEIAGSPGILFEAPHGLDLVSLASALGISAELIAENRPGSYAVQVEGSPSMIARLTTWLAGIDVAVRNLRTGGPMLEDIYMALVGSGESAASVGSGDSPRSKGRNKKEETC